MKKFCHCILLIFSLLLICCQKYKPVPKGSIVYIQIGDSITYGAKNNGGNSPGDFAVRALATPTVYIRMGWPAESASQFNMSRRQQLLDSLNTIPPGHRIILGVAYGANDFPQMQPAQVLASILRVARWAHDTARVAEVLIIPVMNRKDKWAFTYKADGSKVYRFNESRLWLNAQLHIQTRALSGVKVASEADAPMMYADNYPDDTTRCADKVHPFDPGAKELGEGTIACGIASFGKIDLRH